MPMNMILYKKLDKLKIIYFCSKQPCTLIILFMYKGVYYIIILYSNIKKRKKADLTALNLIKTNRRYGVAGI